MEQKEARKIEMIVTPAAIGSKIIVDGKVLPYVRRAELILDPSEASLLKLELFCLDGATVEGEIPVEAIRAPWSEHELEIVGAMRLAIAYLDAGTGGKAIAGRLRKAVDLVQLPVETDTR